MQIRIMDRNIEHWNIDFDTMTWTHKIFTETFKHKEVNDFKFQISISFSLQPSSAGNNRNSKNTWWRMGKSGLVRWPRETDPILESPSTAAEDGAEQENLRNPTWTDAEVGEMGLGFKNLKEGNFRTLAIIPNNTTRSKKEIINRNKFGKF